MSKHKYKCLGKTRIDNITKVIKLNRELGLSKKELSVLVKNTKDILLGAIETKE